MSIVQGKVMTCLHCWNETPHTMVGSHAQEGCAASTAEREVLFLLVCATCGRGSLYVGVAGDYLPLWPSRPGLGAEVPSRVRELYQEAVSVKRRSPGSFAVQVRRALEALCTAERIAGRELAGRLRDLVGKKELPHTMGNVARVARVLGNKGAHDAGVDVTLDEADLVEEFFLALVEYVYVGPSKLKRYQAAIDKLGI